MSDLWLQWQWYLISFIRTVFTPEYDTTRHTFYQYHWWKFWHKFLHSLRRVQMCSAVIHLSEWKTTAIFCFCFWQEAGWNSSADFSSFTPCTFFACVVGSLKMFIIKENKLTRAYSQICLQKTRSAVVAADFFCATLWVYTTWKWTGLVPEALGAINKSFCAP